jgi:pimeloyl-ACP methyl ester carboxylesterase
MPAATAAPSTVGLVRSKDGTNIAFSRLGQGPALIIVDGAMCYRAFGPSGPLAKALQDRFTVYTYDRRGRGESGNTLPYALNREIEDIAALVQEAGGSAYLCGISSGAALALEAANTLPGVTKLALFEAPFIVDKTREPMTLDYWRQIEVASSREETRGEAIALFMKAVGVPGFMIVIMKLMPMWKGMKAVAPTLPYDGACVKQYQQGQPLPRDRWTSVKAQTLVLDGGKSPAWMRNAMKSLASILPGARYGTLAGQTHMVKAQVMAPELIDFFTEA